MKIKFFEDVSGWWYRREGTMWQYGPFTSRDRAIEAATHLCMDMGWTLEIAE